MRSIGLQAWPAWAAALQATPPPGLRQLTLQFTSNLTAADLELLESVMRVRPYRSWVTWRGGNNTAPCMLLGLHTGVALLGYGGMCVVQYVLLVCTFGDYMP